MPHPVRQLVDRLTHRIARLRWATGWCRVATVVLAAAIALGGLDYLVRYVDPGLRVLASLVLAGALVWAVVAFLVPVWRRPMSSLAVARRIEDEFPRLNDRLASSLEFLEQHEDDPLAGSATLRRNVIAQTEVDLADLPVATIVDRRPLRSAAAGLAVALAIVALALAVDPGAVGTAAARLVVPLGDTEWPRTNHLAFVDPPRRLAAGEAFEAELVDEQGALPDDVEIQFRHRVDGRRVVDTRPMIRVGDAMLARRERVERSFQFRAVGGDDHTMPWYTVEVHDPPRIASLELVAHPPAYTGQSATAIERFDSVLAGTRIELRGHSADQLTRMRLRIKTGDEQKVIEGDVASGTDGSEFRVPAQRFLVSSDSTIGIELENDQGIVGRDRPWVLEVVPDSPPTVAWRRPETDLYVLPEAVVAIELAVKDNLAIASVELVFLRSDQSEAGEQVRPLYTGPQQPSATPDGDARVISEQWDLAPLALPPESQLTVNARASDYRPGTGQTLAPRRITIITPEELAARLAARQTRIIQRLEQVLALERTTRGQVAGLEIQQREVGQLSEEDRATLQAAELSQRRADRELTSDEEGVLREINALADELQTNRLDRPELDEQGERLREAIARLASGPLPEIEQALTSASKLAQTSSEGPQLANSLELAGQHQDDVIRELERMVGDLSQAAGFRQFAQSVEELRRDQLRLRESTEQTVQSRATTSDRQRQADLEKIATDQTALGRRFDRLERDMREMSDELAAGDPAAAATLADALDEARQLGTRARIEQATREVRAGRTGRALDQQQQVADDLRALVDTLRNRHEQDLARLVEKLRQAEGQLQALREELAGLRSKIEAAEAEPDSAARSQSLEQLEKESADVREEIQRMARQLERLEAQRASQSTERAAGRLAEQSSPDESRPSTPSGQQARQAEQDLEEAADELAERRRQAEADLAQQQMARFETALKSTIQQQQRVLDDTIELDALRQAAGKLSFAQAQSVLALADLQRALAHEVQDFAELLSGLGVFRLALSETVLEMDTAAGRLEDRDTSNVTQQAQQAALRRLEQIAEALENERGEAGDPAEGGDAGAGEPGDADSDEQALRLNLSELKLLRAMQVELGERTREFENRLSSANEPIEAAEKEALARRAAELAAQQGRLAALVLEIASRDNREASARDDQASEQQLQELLERLDDPPGEQDAQ